MADDNLTFEQALSIAISVEVASKNAQDLQKPSTSAKCFNVSKTVGTNGRKQLHPVINAEDRSMKQLTVNSSMRNAMHVAK